LMPGRVAGEGAARTREGAAGNSPPPPAGPILTCQECPLCGAADGAVVCEFNRFVVFDRRPDDEAARYDYRLCFSCGVLYASRRPAGERYRWLIERFEETIGRDTAEAANPAKLTASVFELTAAEKQNLQRQASRGVFVSDHLGVSRKEYLPALLADRLAAGPHVELLGSLLELRTARVLEIRSRTGSIAASLKRLYDADVRVMTMFENQRFVTEEAYGIPATAPIDFERFQMPDARRLDLIIANHMLTHAVHPREFLERLHDHLEPDGHVYFYNEPEDAEFLAERKSMFNTLNAFHLQAFDHRSLARALQANGFTIAFMTRFDGNILCLARRAARNQSWEHMRPRERDRRLAAYRLARDASILMLPPHARRLFAAEWDDVVDRAFDAGIAEVGEDGRPRLKRVLH
jgi:2-polyprenyl-3-methyl-5-hydroxy-6-metoxy-1,4-benzoquinol methylase